MSKRTLGQLAVLAAVGLLSVGAASSPAATYLHDNATSGSLLPAGTTIMPRPSTDTMVIVFPGFGTFTCANNTFDATVGASGGATITGTLHSLTFTECADTIPVLTYSSCHLVNGTPTVTITATSHSGGTIGANDVTLKCNTSATTGCYYTAATFPGAINNTGATLSYTNIGFVHTTGPGDLGAICGNGASFSTTFTDLTSGGTGRTVVLNQTP